MKAIIAVTTLLVVVVAVVSVPGGTGVVPVADVASPFAAAGSVVGGTCESSAARPKPWVPPPPDGMLVGPRVGSPVGPKLRLRPRGGSAPAIHAPDS